MNRLAIFICLGLLPLFFQTPAHSVTERFDAKEVDNFIAAGSDILSIEYCYVKNSGVFPETPGYPDGLLRFALYIPKPYDGKPEMDEGDWKQSDEIAVFNLPGPRMNGKWRSEDLTAYMNAGMLDWSKSKLDKAVFRIFIDHPTELWESDTLIWGTIARARSINSLVFENDNISISFRSTDLPEDSPEPEIIVNSIKFEHNVKENGILGMKIHVDFQVDYLRTSLMRIAAYIHVDRLDEPVVSQITDPDLSTPEGYLTAQKNFIPLFTMSKFTDFALFIPYSAFPRSSNYTDYYAVVEIQDENWEFLKSERSPNFSVLNP